MTFPCVVAFPSIPALAFRLSDYAEYAVKAVRIQYCYFAGFLCSWHTKISLSHSLSCITDKRNIGRRTDVPLSPFGPFYTCKNLNPLFWTSPLGVIEIAFQCCILIYYQVFFESLCFVIFSFSLPASLIETVIPNNAAGRLLRHPLLPSGNSFDLTSLKSTSHQIPRMIIAWRWPLLCTT